MKFEENDTMQSRFVVLHLLICLHSCLALLFILIVVLLTHQALNTTRDIG